MVAVVHLVWGPLGVVPLRNFLASYNRHSTGLEHELVILFNGVQDAQRVQIEGELHDTEHRLLTLGEPMQDLAAYARMIQVLEHDRLCFLNSHSVILADDWLVKLSNALDQPGTGMVGATGSWASTRSAVLNSLFLPNAYRGVIPERRVAREQLLGIELEKLGGGVPTSTSAAKPSLARSIVATLRTLPPKPEQLLRFGGFPAKHLRTNAFMARHSTFRQLRITNISRKMDAYILESGHTNLTRQVHDLGLRTLVVARDGNAFEPDVWPQSRTLWQGNQEGLLIADNQTRMYARGNFDRRRLLSAQAWGRMADPGKDLRKEAQAKS
jgi:hypothetical protein